MLATQTKTFEDQERAVRAAIRACAQDTLLSAWLEHIGDLVDHSTCDTCHLLALTWIDLHGDL